MSALVLQMSTSVTKATQKAAHDAATAEERLADVKRELQEERRKVGVGWEAAQLYSSAGTAQLWQG